MSAPSRFLLEGRPRGPLEWDFRGSSEWEYPDSISPKSASGWDLLTLKRYAVRGTVEFSPTHPFYWFAVARETEPRWERTASGTMLHHLKNREMEGVLLQELVRLALLEPLTAGWSHQQRYLLVKAAQAKLPDHWPTLRQSWNFVEGLVVRSSWFFPATNLSLEAQMHQIVWLPCDLNFHRLREMARQVTRCWLREYQKIWRPDWETWKRPIPLRMALKWELEQIPEHPRTQLARAQLQELCRQIRVSDGKHVGLESEGWEKTDPRDWEDRFIGERIHPLELGHWKVPRWSVGMGEIVWKAFQKYRSSHRGKTKFRRRKKGWSEARLDRTPTRRTGDRVCYECGFDCQAHWAHQGARAKKKAGWRRQAKGRTQVPKNPFIPKAFTQEVEEELPEYRPLPMMNLGDLIP